MGFGMFAFTALGDRYFAYGALAGLYAATTAGLGKADASASSRLSLLLTDSVEKVRFLSTEKIVLLKRKPLRCT